MRQFVSERPDYAQPAASAPPGRPVRVFALHHSSAVKCQHPSECGGGVVAVWGGGRKSKTEAAAAAAAQADSDERRESRGAGGRERERLRLHLRRESEALEASQSGRSFLLHLHVGLNVCLVFYFSTVGRIQAALQTLMFLVLCNPTCACSHVSATLHSTAFMTPCLVSSDGR